jgi:hypothetical protein
LPLAKEGWCYNHHLSGHTTETCELRASVAPNRTRQYFRRELHETPDTQLSAARTPHWNKAIEELKTLEDVLSLLHCVDAWIAEYYNFIQERDSFQLELLTDFFPVIQCQQELVELYISLKEQFTQANICSENLIKGVGTILKNFYSNDFIPIVRQLVQAYVKHWKLDKKEKKELFAGSMPIAELFSYLPRVYAARRGPREFVIDAIPSGDTFPILQLQQDINNTCMLYMASRMRSAKKNEQVDFRPLFGLTKHANKENVIALMQPQIRTELNEWIELPRIPSHSEWLRQSQRTQANHGQLQELLQQEQIKLQPQPQLATEPATETAVKEEEDVAAEASRLRWEHGARNFAQRLTIEAAALAKRSKETVSLPVYKTEPK